MYLLSPMLFCLGPIQWVGHPFRKAIRRSYGYYLPDLRHRKLQQKPFSRTFMSPIWNRTIQRGSQS